MPHLHKMSAVLLSAKQGKTSLRKKKNIINVAQGCYFKGYTTLFSEKSCETQITAANRA